jgi:hypothetical protein
MDREERVWFEVGEEQEDCIQSYYIGTNDSQVNLVELRSSY